MELRETNLVNKYDEMSFEETLKSVKVEFPNWAKKHYVKHSNTYLGQRVINGKVAAKAIRKHFANRQAIEFHERKTAYVMTERENNRLELLADYILAEDHAQGLQLRRKPRTWDEVAFAERNLMSKMGEGAQEYAELSENGELTDDVIRKVKLCAICEHPFIDTTKNLIKKRCGKSCESEHQRRRNRAGNKGNKGDHRYKRERERQQLEYGFYSPVELSDIEKHGETIFATDSFDYGVLAVKALGGDIVGHRKDKYEISDDWYDKESVVAWNSYYERFDKRPEIAWGEVQTYKLGVDITAEELENTKFVSAKKMPRIADFDRRIR